MRIQVRKSKRLLREAAEDPQFKELLLSERSRAAQRIGVVLDVPEAAILDSVAEEQLKAMIEKTPRGPEMNYDNTVSFLQPVVHRRIDVLLRKAKEDPQFMEWLLVERSRAAQRTGVMLSTAEITLLDSVSEEQLAAMIEKAPERIPVNLHPAKVLYGEMRIINERCMGIRPDAK